MTLVPGERYGKLFRALEARREGAFIPFVMLGDPDLPTSARILRTLVGAGADALELGIPFSDPIADGPVIQAAASRALAAGTRTAQCWKLLAALRADIGDLPVGLLVYANLVAHDSPDAFYGAAADAGVDSVLVADLPMIEAEPFATRARHHGVAPVFIAPPNADAGRLDAIAGRSVGYTYVVTRGGVTGADERIREESAELVAGLKARGAAPPVLGFGIATPAHLRASLAMGAAGAISGSAIVRRVAEFRASPADLERSLTEFVRGMKAATLPPTEASS